MSNGLALLMTVCAWALIAVGLAATGAPWLAIIAIIVGINVLSSLATRYPR